MSVSGGLTVLLDCSHCYRKSTTVIAGGQKGHVKKNNLYASFRQVRETVISVCLAEKNLNVRSTGKTSVSFSAGSQKEERFCSVSKHFRLGTEDF